LLTALQPAQQASARRLNPLAGRRTNRIPKTGTAYGIRTPSKYLPNDRAAAVAVRGGLTEAQVPGCVAFLREKLARAASSSGHCTGGFTLAAWACVL
jgi:transcriptional regulator GlxA family with amidase domain